MKIRIIILFTAISLSSVSFGALTYVDLSASNTARYSGTGAWTVTGGGSSTDNLWLTRTFGNGSTIYEANQDGTAGENAPGLKTTLTGLTVGATYTVEAYFWSNVGDNWRLRGSLTTVPPLDDNIIRNFSRSGTLTSNNAPALATGVDVTDNLGVTYSGTGTIAGNSAVWTSTSYFTTGVLIGQGNRALYRASLGSAVADGSGQIIIYLDDYSSGYLTSGANRTWLDGVGYEVVPEPTAALLGSLSLLGLLRRRR